MVNAEFGGIHTIGFFSTSMILLSIGFKKSQCAKKVVQYFVGMITLLRN